MHDQVIAAKRHIHMTPETAEKEGFTDGQIVSVKVKGDREITFGEIYPLVSRAAEETPFVQHPDIETIFETDRLARARARALMKG